MLSTFSVNSEYRIAILGWAVILLYEIKSQQRIIRNENMLKCLNNVLGFFLIKKRPCHNRYNIVLIHLVLDHL